MPPQKKRREDDILPYRYLNISSYPNQKQSFHFAVRRNFTPQVFRLPTAANFTRRRRISLFNRPLRLNPLPPSGREGDREAVEGARGYESNGLPFMRCLPLFSLVEAEVSSLLCAFSFRHPCGAGRRGEATAPCSHSGGSHSDSHRRADMKSTPTKSKAKRREEQAPPLPRSQVLRRWMRCATSKETAGG